MLKNIWKNIKLKKQPILTTKCKKKKDLFLIRGTIFLNSLLGVILLVKASLNSYPPQNLKKSK